MHVTIDGFGGNAQRLADEAAVRSLLDRYPADIGMTPIAPPYVTRYVGSKPEDWGISGFVLIAESHIALHTFPDHGYVWLDIFSCKAFEADPAIDVIRRQFELQDLRVSVLERGLEYPHAVPQAVPIAAGERRAVAAALVKPVTASGEG